MLSERQELILNYLIKEYIDSAKPISSGLLKERCRLDVSPATIRNELQELTLQGYIVQPHTSAGRVPTNKAYRYYISVIFSTQEETFPRFIIKEIEEAKQKIETELKLAQELTESLTQISSLLDFNRIEEDALFDVLKIIGPSRTTYNRNIDVMKELLKQLENF